MGSLNYQAGNKSWLTGSREASRSFPWRNKSSCVLFFSEGSNGPGERGYLELSL